MRLWVPALIAALCVCAAIAAGLKRVSARQELLMNRMRTSGTYLYVQPLLHACRELRIDQIVLRPEAVTVTLFSPAGKKLQCVFDQYGLDSLEPEPLSALAQLAAVEIPALADNSRYFFKKRRERMDNGSMLIWYEYMVQPKYKDSILRSGYDRTFR